MKTPNPKCCFLSVLNRVYRLDIHIIQSAMLVFSTGFVTCALLTFYLVSSLPPSPPPFPAWVSVLCTRIQCVMGWGVVRGHRRVGGLRQIKHLPQSNFTGQFFKITTFSIAFYQSNLSTYETIHFLITCCNCELFFRKLRLHSHWFHPEAASGKGKHRKLRFYE